MQNISVKLRGFEVLCLLSLICILADPRVIQYFHQSYPLVWVFAKHPLEEILKLTGKMVRQLIIIILYLLFHLLNAFTLERTLSRGKLIKHDAKRPDVALLSILPREYFRGQVLDGSRNHHLGLLSFLKNSDAKVN